MNKAQRHARINTAVWAHIKYKADEANSPFRIGQELLVDPPEHSFLPCIPKPMEENPTHGLTRIPKGTMITYCGLIELSQDVLLMHFLYDGNNHVLMGLGVVPFLTRPPAFRKYKKKKKTLSKTSPLYLAKLQLRKRIDR